MCRLFFYLIFILLTFVNTNKCALAQHNVEVITNNKSLVDHFKTNKLCNIHYIAQNKDTFLEEIFKNYSKKTMIILEINNHNLHLLEIKGKFTSNTNFLFIITGNLSSILSDYHQLSFFKPKFLSNVITLDPSSYLASIISNKSQYTNNGWIILNFNQNKLENTNQIPITSQNVQNLKNAGYKVTGFSQNGNINLIEDLYGNIYFNCLLEELLHDQNGFFLEFLYTLFNANSSINSSTN